MKTFKDLLIEAKGLKKVSRGKGKEAQRKFAMRQAARSASKFGSGETVKTPRMSRPVPSFRAIGAQFGVDVSPDASGQYGSSDYTPTEDKALSGNVPQDKEAQNLFRKTFLKLLSKNKKLGSS
jgi:hypothetical protein